MPHQNKPYEVKIPHSSGFDMSHRNSGSLTCGTLTPLLVEECIPGTKCNLRTNIAVQLPPLVSDTYMNLKLKVEAFCVPMRLLCRSFEDWFNDFPKRVLSFSAANASSANRVFTNVKAKLPVLRLSNSYGSQYGRAYGVGSDFIIDNFEVVEPSFIMVLQSLVPEVTYSSGVAAYLRRYISEGSVTEMATPLLQNIGDEPIKAEMLSNDFDQDTGNDVFGFQDRFGSFMFHPNEAHGLLRDGQSLASFVLQRSFNSFPQISDAFLQIPKNYLDSAFAVPTAVSGLSAWYDAKLDWKITMPLAEFSIPSLQDPAYEHGKSVYLRRNGQIL